MCETFSQTSEAGDGANVLNRVGAQLCGYNYGNHIVIYMGIASRKGIITEAHLSLRVLVVRHAASP